MIGYFAGKTNTMKRIGIILHGCGVFDGTEIQEATMAMLAIREAEAEYRCYAPDRPQHHVINHANGQEMPETRNILVESARISRGQIEDIRHLNLDDLDGLLIPGGFGAAKNLSTWAFDGPAATVLPEVREILIAAVEKGIPIAALCVSPVVLAKAFEGTDWHARLTLGTTAAASPYDIAGFHAGIGQVGAHPAEATIEEIVVDQDLKIVTAPCYMMETDILGIRNNAKLAVERLLAF